MPITETMPMTRSLLLLLLLLSHFSTSTAAYPTIPGTTDTSVLSGSHEDKLIPRRREVYGEGRIFDITHRYTSDMPSMGKEKGLGQFLWPPYSLKNESFCNISEMKLITHTGTHADAPGHFYFDAGFDVDTLDLEVLNGLGLLIDVPRGTNITGLDYSSMSAWSDLAATDLILHENREIILAEGLKLDGIQPGIYSIHCLPIRLLRAEGSPIRCILIK